MKVASPCMSGSGACPSLPVLKAVPDHVFLPEAGAADGGHGKAGQDRTGQARETRFGWLEEGERQVRCRCD